MNTILLPWTRTAMSKCLLLLLKLQFQPVLNMTEFMEDAITERFQYMTRKHEG